MKKRIIDPKIKRHFSSYLECNSVSARIYHYWTQRGAAPHGGQAHACDVGACTYHWHPS